jgi:decaprenyl-phosphate phosphoribosyltransferase
MPPTDASDETGAQTSPRRPLAASLLRLMRPAQWAKSAFVLIGPAYGYADMETGWREVALPALLAAVAFSLVSSACYIVNDILDAEQDRAHPRKRRRPIASGAVSPAQGAALAIVLAVGAGVCLWFIPAPARAWTAAWVAAYVANVTLYSAVLKHVLIADVMGLALGFVLRVMAGCAAVGIVPSVWLLNCTLFLAMFLAFGKRLGERRTLGEGATAARTVQRDYTTSLLQMAVVVTAVATLVNYTSYVQTQVERVGQGFEIFWLTVLPATYGLFRCIVLLDAGRYDDPTELATHDRPFQGASLAFAALSAAAIWWFRMQGAA